MIRHNRNRFRPSVCHLDMRQLPAAQITAALANGVLTVRGTQKADVINVTVGDKDGGAIAVSGLRKTFAASRVAEVVVLGRKGDDTINVAGPGLARIAVRVNGGPGNNRIGPAPAVAGATATAPVPVVAAPVSLPVVTTTASAIPPASASAMSQQIVALINSARASANLAPLAVSATLTQEAAIQSTNMAQLNTMSHVLPGTNAPTLSDRAAAVGYRFTKIGENIAYNYSDANSVVAAWLASPDHYANIMDPAFTETGVSVAYSASGKPYITQEFGRPA